MSAIIKKNTNKIKKKVSKNASLHAVKNAKKE